MSYPSKLTPVSTYGPSREVIPPDFVPPQGPSDYTPTQETGYYPDFGIGLASHQVNKVPTTAGINNFIDLETGTACIKGYVFKLKSAEIKRIKKTLVEGAIADLKKAESNGPSA